MSTQLEQIAAKAKADRTLRFTSLAHLLTPAFLIETWRQMNRRGASGVDGETTTEFERELETRVQDICARLKAGTYRAPPVRRVEIPKGPGKVGTRPLGIPTVEDRLVQRAVARIVEAVFEADFLDCSYGFRPRRSAHDALRTLRATLVTKRVRHLYEADIRGYFNHINHQWLKRMVAHRIADGVILRLIGKWLRAGVMQDGVVVRTEAGTPQGGPLSPVLANVYLHFVLDLWFEKKVRRWLRGEASLIRFADDCARPKPLLLRDERSPHHKYPKSVSSLGPGATGQPVPSKQDRHNVLEGSAMCGVVRSPGTETNLQAAIAMNDRCAPVSVYPAVIAARAGTGVAEPPVVGRRLLSMVDELGMRTHRGSRGEGGSMQGQSRGVRLETPPGPPMLAVETEDIRPEAEVPTEAWVGSRRGSYERRRRVMPLEQRAPTSVTLAREGRTA